MKFIEGLEFEYFLLLAWFIISKKRIRGYFLERDTYYKDKIISVEK